MRKSLFTIWANNSTSMVFEIGSQFKVLYSIITSDTVDMMNILFFSKKPTEKLFHYKTMFGNIARFCSMRMVTFFNQCISLPNGFTTFPTRVILTAISYASRLFNTGMTIGTPKRTKFPFGKFLTRTQITAFKFWRQLLATGQAFFLWIWSFKILFPHKYKTTLVRTTGHFSATISRVFLTAYFTNSYHTLIKPEVGLYVK